MDKLCVHHSTKNKKCFYCKKLIDWWEKPKRIITDGLEDKKRGDRYFCNDCVDDSNLGIYDYVYCEICGRNRFYQPPIEEWVEMGNHNYFATVCDEKCYKNLLKLEKDVCERRKERFNLYNSFFSETTSESD